MRTLYLAIIPAILFSFLIACSSSPTSTPLPSATVPQPSATIPQPSATVPQPSATAPEPSEPSDQQFSMQFVCINRSLQTCDLFTDYVARVEERSNGQLKLDITSLPELGISGTDMLDLLGGVVKVRV